MPRRPRILVTTHGPEQAAREEPTWQTFARYVAAVERAGGEAMLIDPQATADQRARALDAMDGLLLPGGADLDPALYGYHHQAIRPDQLGSELTVAGTTLDGAQVEAFEASDPDAWVFGVQNHPERPEFTPPEFARLWQAFVDAARSGRRRRS